MYSEQLLERTFVKLTNVQSAVAAENVCQISQCTVSSCWREYRNAIISYLLTRKNIDIENKSELFYNTDPSAVLQIYCSA